MKVVKYNRLCSSIRDMLFPDRVPTMDLARMLRMTMQTLNDPL